MRKCAIPFCGRTQCLWSARSPQEMALWKNAISYTGKAVKNFWICQGHFSENQFKQDLRQEWDNIY